MSRAHRGYVKHAALLIAAAFITVPAFAATDVVTNLSDTGVSGDGSLRGEIKAAAAGDTIVFAPGLTGPITLLSSTSPIQFSGPCALTITKNLTISGPGASVIAVNGNGVGSVFCVSSIAAISGLTIENGKAGSTGFGGGINAAGGSTLTVTNCIISNNSAGTGGAMNNGGTGTVTNSTISGNTAGIGGGIFNGGILTVINSTFSGNAATGFGGGIYNASDLTVTNSTISVNSASSAGGIFDGPNSTTLKSTILATNGVGGNCAGPGTITSAGYNLSDDTSCSTFTQTGDLSDVPAGLDPNGLQNNGGPTPTIALLRGSFAVDAIPPAACTDQSTPPVPVTTDQRGILRPQGNGCDIGAYELAAAGAFQVRYVSNLNIGDSVINITNDGQTVPQIDPVLPTSSNLCIGVYTFDANEELQSCCACLVTPNGLVSLSAHAITATSLTGENPSSLVVKLLAWSTTAGASSTAPPGTPAPPTSSSCNPATPGAISGGMHAWGTTVHALPPGGPSTYTVTETEFSPGNLSPAEYAHITQSCEFNQINGSGTSGQCKGCASGGQ